MNTAGVRNFERSIGTGTNVCEETSKYHSGLKITDLVGVGSSPLVDRPISIEGHGRTTNDAVQGDIGCASLDARISFGERFKSMDEIR